ncbi:MAG: catalase [Alphaproteobacteria bacterium]|nr:catalase [Alphaproteobacteria bacterium]
MNEMPSHPLEIVPAQEAAMIERVTALQTEIMKSRDPTKRGQHPKHQALVRGFFEVAESLPDRFRVGVFAEPKKFAAFVRISTGPMPKDSDPNPHAMAIKLVDVPGSPTGTQDFIMLDQPTFFIRDVAEYVKFFDAAHKDPAAASYFKCRPREFGLNLTFNVVIGSHLERQYWSEVPVAMGKCAARLTLIPGVENVSGQAPATTADGLRDALEDYFVKSRRPAKFVFAAQTYIDEATTPIEDATSVWPTPFEPIATLTLPAQDFTAPAQFEFGENLSYTPWHCVPDHQPLGGIQRCRKRVYEESSRVRHQLTGGETREPTKADYDAFGETF